MNQAKYIGIIAVLIIDFLLGFGGGRLTKQNMSNPSPTPVGNLTPLRLDGRKLTNPLLACDLVTDNNSTQLKPLQEKITTIINQEKQNGNVNSVAIYFRDYSKNLDLTINPEEKFYPASLNKIPVMIAAFKEAESNPGFLSKKVSLRDNTDYNIQQEIKPRDFVKPGATYTILDAVEKMITFSDNNAFYLLAQQVNPDIFTQTFKDLKISLREDVNSPSDYMTAESFSYFLRVLYNATYINRESSEKALEILSRVDYKGGLAADLPNDVIVAHKFGLLGNLETTNAARELHDCGIIYRDNGNYLLCIMTKSSGSLSQAENTIKAISNTVFTELNTFPKNP